VAALGYLVFTLELDRHRTCLRRAGSIPGTRRD
jgi:hypothetical protein